MKFEYVFKKSQKKFEVRISYFKYGLAYGRLFETERKVQDQEGHDRKQTVHREKILNIVT